MQKDDMQKSQFFKALHKILPKMPKVVCSTEYVYYMRQVVADESIDIDNSSVEWTTIVVMETEYSNSSA